MIATGFLRLGPEGGGGGERGRQDSLDDLITTTTLTFTGLTVGCARCHSIRGRGGRSGPDLTRVARNAKHTPPWLAEQVANPQAHNPTSRMPAFGEQIQDADLQALAAYLATLK